MFFLWYLLIGLFAGWIANLIVRGGGSGLIINLIVGLVGGLLGGWIFSWFGWVPESTFGSIICSIIGAWCCCGSYRSYAPPERRRYRHARLHLPTVYISTIDIAERCGQSVATPRGGLFFHIFS